MKTLRKYFAITTVILTGMLLVTSCNKDDEPATPTNPIEPAVQSIVGTASSNDDFSILVEAVVKADLVDALEGDGPFTVMAPTNAAFTELFAALNVSGVEDIPAVTLKEILLYHVIGAKAMSTDLSTGYFETLNTYNPGQMGSSLLVEVENGVMINSSSKVVAADIEATNGVIHVIDKVLLPQNVVEIAISNPNFSILVEAVLKADLAGALTGKGPFTIFAPTNEAFEALFAELKVSGISDLSAEALTPILLYHVVSGNVNASQVTSGWVPTLNAEATLNINVGDRGVSINGSSNVIAVDVQGNNGVIHAIDKVL